MTAPGLLYGSDASCHTCCHAGPPINPDSACCDFSQVDAIIANAVRSATPPEAEHLKTAEAKEMAWEAKHAEHKHAHAPSPK